MKKVRNTVNKLNLIASIGFYIASLLFIAAAIIGKNFIYITVGLAFICSGTLFLIISLRNEKNCNDSEHTEKNDTDSKTDKEQKQ